ncbi:hypothetical protein [Cupriavidus necator]|uniref:hypothetical protein n=1 Tax=Cupriavidus necator TaxID=106590 RepID=UPI000991B1FB|nr:hypothetical protein [Cupriavidus necator]
MTFVGATGLAQSNIPSAATVLSTTPTADTIAAIMVQKADRLAAAAACADSVAEASRVSASLCNSAASFVFLK